MAKKAKNGKRGGWGKSAPGRQAAGKVKAPKALKAKQKANGRAKEKPAKKPGPRSQVLPGMEQVRDAMLDKICEQFGEEIDSKNAAIRESESLKVSALTRMQALGINVFVHAGTEFARVPGVGEKLRARRIKGDGDAEVGKGETRRGDSDEVVTHADDQNEPTADEQDAADEFTVADV